MDVPAARPGSGDTPSTPAERDASLRALRARWRTASLAAGWRFPSDWALPEVDAVCAAVMAKGRVEAAETALAGLARARAAAGAGLAETLADLAALHAVLGHSGDGFVSPDVDATPARLLRTTALAWADVATDQLVHTEVTDPLTGLPSAAYLRTRLAEVYRAAEARERPAAEDHVLLVVSLDLSAVAGFPRLTGMILVADALRTVFDSGQSVASLGPSVVAALVPKDERVASQGVALRRALHERLQVDAQLADVGRPRVSAVRLPATHELACDLLAHLARA
ncbi:MULTISPECIES: GGDEF domain-containing protein [unclassified Amycolatopsis]|uniref:GGDEF domain-containing protein n=1 Tax=unclassified Amycolatopsis TaxID=2618356 RepID=UPI0028772315|nr:MULTISPECIES: GGDEF domain-containing protein [unclassified Amycolatopsis]MDS0135149.1 GGDEF domain-containing protein [Amycolatopsis sp. 505]MDS0143074.1 GGDEF domain-containing protein [Amycolatopsis sp. CM201R]